MRASFLTLLMATLLPAAAQAQPLTYALSGGSDGWPQAEREQIVASMDEAVALYNAHGFFDKHVTANYSAGVLTAQANYDGWIDFGGSRNTRVALHEIAHALGVGTIGGFDGAQWSETSAAGKLIKIYEGNTAVINTGGTHFWPYGLNYDNEDGAAARVRHVRIVSALRFDQGIVGDSDGDGLPDDWEMHHFGDLAQGAMDDPDGDAILNRDEHATDTDPNLAAPVRDGGTYVVRCQITGLALSVRDGSGADGALTEQRAYDGSASQQWIAHYLGLGWFTLENAASGKLLDILGATSDSGASIVQWGLNGGDNQRWRFAKGIGANDGFFQIASRATGRVVDGLDGADGAPVQQYPYIGGIPQQFWSFEAVENPDLSPGDAGVDAGEGEGEGAAAVDADAGAGAGSSLVDGDAGTVALDGGSAGPATSNDAGSVAEGGAPSADAGVGSSGDAGVVVPNVDAGAGWAPSSDGVGCSGAAGRVASGAGAWLAFGSLGGLGLAFRRRRRTA